MAYRHKNTYSGLVTTLTLRSSPLIVEEREKKASTRRIAVITKIIRSSY